MSEQAQASTTIGAAAARSTRRTRPSRAKGAAGATQPRPARPNGAANPRPEAAEQQRPAAAETDQSTAEAQGSEAETDRYEAGRAAALAEMRQQEESVRQESERAEAAAREAAARAAAEHETARVGELLANYRTLMSAASICFNHASTAMVEISSTLTWEPSKAATVDDAIAKAARGLADFRTYLHQAQGLGAEQHLRAEDPDVGGSFVMVLDAYRELRRRIDAQIAVLETDLTNVPALLAMERSIAEQGLLVTVMSRGFGRMLAQEGLAR